MFRKHLLQAMACGIVCSWNNGVYAQHHGDVVVGRSLGGQLKGEFDGEVFLLDSVSGPFLFGWIGDDPGFEHLESDEPDEDFYRLPTGVQVRLECVSLTPGLKVWGAGLSTLMDEPGERILLGDDELHTHVLWHIDTQDPNYLPGQKVWEATLRFVDTGLTGLAPSDSFVLTFSHAAAVPTVSEWGVGAMALLMLVAGSLVFRKRLADPVGVCRACLTLAVLGPDFAQARAQHAGDIWVGQSAGRIAVHPGGFVPGTEYLELFRVDSVFAGWSNNEPGFEAARTVLGGVAPLPHGASISLRVVRLDPALLIIDGAFNVLADPGDSTLLGGHDLHAHLTFFVDEFEPGFDPHQCAWEVILQLRDTGGGLLDSTPFSLLFSIVPVRHEEDPADGDFNEDGKASGPDQKPLSICLGGPDRRPAGGLPHEICEVDCQYAFDFDNDLDVDLSDYARIQTLFRP